MGRLQREKPLPSLNRESSHFWQACKQLLPTLSVLSLLIFTLVALFEYSNIQWDRNRLIEREMAALATAREFIQHEASLAITDLEMLADDPDFRHPADGTAPLTQHAQEHLITLMRHRSRYDQGRLITPQGREVARVNFAGGGTVVPPDQLQDKSHRDYYTQGSRVGKNGLYISPLNLNMENGTLERPFKPVIRFVKPIYDQSGNQLGLLVLNYLAQPFLDRVRGLENTSKGKPLLTDSQGHWLIGPSPNLSWSRQLDKQRDLAAIFPEFYELNRPPSGAYRTSQGLFIYQTFDLVDAVQPHAQTIKSVDVQTPRLTLISHVSAEVLADQTKEHVLHGIALCALFLLAAAPIALLWLKLRLNSIAKQAEVDRLQLRFRHQLDKAVDAIFIHDPEGHFVEVNDRACSSTGYSRAELLSMHVSNLEVGANKHDLSEIWPRMVAGEQVQLEGRHRRKDGSTFPVEVNIGLIATDELLIQAIVRDVSSRRRLEQQLKESEERYRKLFELAADAIFVVNPDGKITQSNQRASILFGYTKAELRALHLWDLDVAIDKTQCQDTLAQLQEGGSCLCLGHYRHKNGTVIPTEISGRKLFGTGAQTQIMVRDLTQRTKVEAVLEELAKGGGSQNGRRVF